MQPPPHQNLPPPQNTFVHCKYAIDLFLNTEEYSVETSDIKF